MQGEQNRPDKNDAIRAFSCLADYVYLCDENTTVNGTVSIMDGVLAFNQMLKLQGYVTLEERRDFIQTWQVLTNSSPHLMIVTISESATTAS